MKKLSLVILMLMVVVVLFADGLNSDAQYLKSDFPEYYEVVKQRAINEWQEDNVMIVYTINSQAKALFECSELANDYDRIVRIQVEIWCDDDIYKYDNGFLAPVDWVMVLYSAKAQIKAQSQY